VAGGNENGAGRTWLEHASGFEAAQLGGGLVVGESRPICALARHADVDLRRGEDAGRPITGVRAEPPVVARPVALLVMTRCSRRQGGEGRRATEHLLGEHRVKLDAVELRPRERAGLVPDRVRHGARAEVVEESRPANGGRVLVGEPEDAGGVCRELGTSRRRRRRRRRSWTSP